MLPLLASCVRRGASVYGQVGCLKDSSSPGSNYCYVVGPTACPIALSSIVFRGAGYRPCEPTIETNPTYFDSVLDILASVSALAPPAAASPM